VCRLFSQSQGNAESIDGEKARIAQDTIKHKKPSSVYELSRILNRDLKNVLQDVAYFAGLGIVKVEETKDKKIPSVAYDRIAFEIAI
jgi:predicted transcriptional regulator